MKITIRMLRGACEEQVYLFRDTFPCGAEVTLENCLKAAAAGLDISWAAERFLTAPAWAEYKNAAAAAAEYKNAAAAAWAEYKKAAAAAFYELFSDPKNQR